MRRQDYTRHNADTDSEDEEEEWYPRMPKSALRLQDTRTPANPTRYTVRVQQGDPPPIPRRASLNQPTSGQEKSKKTEDLQRRWRPHSLLIVGLTLIVAILGYLFFTTVGNWLTNMENHWQYGYPRTAQYDVVVGHHDSTAHPSHFIAVNYNGQVEVIEFPGGDAAHAHIYTGIAIIGQNVNLVPVTLAFQDVNGDGKPNMIVIVGNTHYLFLNENGQFVKSNS